jgi:hypothetical protein
VTSATYLWNWYYGRDKYEDKPVEGGVHKLETDYGKIWKKDWTESNKRFLRRIKNAALLMKEEKGNQPTRQYLAEMDELFTSVSPFELLMKKRKKERDTHRGGEEAAEELCDNSDEVDDNTGGNSSSAPSDDDDCDENCDNDFDDSGTDNDSGADEV